jgi:hypothetical protein
MAPQLFSWGRIGTCMPAPAGSATCVKLEEAVREAPRASHRLPGAGGRTRARTGARTMLLYMPYKHCWGRGPG